MVQAIVVEAVGVACALHVVWALLLPRAWRARCAAALARRRLPAAARREPRGGGSGCSGCSGCGGDGADSGAERSVAPIRLHRRR